MLRIRSLPMLAAASLVTAVAFAAPPPVNNHPELREMAGAVKASNLHATDAALVGFGTRHTLSTTTSKTRGIGAARRWVAAQFEMISKGCGGCLEIVTPSQVFTGERMPKDGAEVMDVVAIQQGSSSAMDVANRVIVMTAHLDSRRSDVMDATGDSPGANDDAAGVAALIETARVLSKYKFPATLVYSADSGEEQGLFGGKIIAQYAVDHGWNVEANLNNDMVGNSHGGNGAYDPHTIRVFSEGTKTNETLQQAAYRRYHGGGVDSPSRNIARYMQSLAEQYLDDFHVRMVYRTDRWGRSGDQVPFLEQGFPAVRLSESNEDYDRQHQNVRVENGVHYGDVISGVDFDYLANVTRLDAITMASLAMAPPPPSDLGVKGAVAYDTTLSWKPSPGAASYNAWWRETTAPQWQHVQNAGDADSVVLKNIILDDWFFGVSAISKDGWESPVEFPGFAGSFARSPKLGPGGKPVDERYPRLFGKFGGGAVGPASWQTGGKPSSGRTP
ncbi:MAG: M28 family peptidase [Xanthomonadales bacterium]|nr:M28 family peptidase [Xanthomonadales bacterium]ODU93217.1 MAG: peptidase M28 [Rhodanobacter sp. SCN 66-43]OJY82121.1 MAG: peptidase M28 [Xanthomonadales bacterium 66-474]